MILIKYTFSLLYHPELIIELRIENDIVNIWSESHNQLIFTELFYYKLL